MNTSHSQRISVYGVVSEIFGVLNELTTITPKELNSEAENLLLNLTQKI